MNITIGEDASMTHHAQELEHVNKVLEELETRETKPIAQLSGLSITLPIEHLIEIITCVGETRGKSGYCGGARISDRTAALVKGVDKYDTLYYLDGPFSRDHKDEPQFYVLWHLHEWRQREAIRELEREQFTIERIKNAEEVERRGRVIVSLMKHQERMSYKTPNREACKVFMEMLVESASSDANARRLLESHGYYNS